MPITSVSLSTSAVPGPSAPIVLNWRYGRPVLFQVTTNSSVAIGDFTVQYTLDDIQLSVNSSVYPFTGSPTYLSSVNAVWVNLSSAAWTSPSAAGTHYTSSTIFPDGLSGNFLAPPAALRLFSSAQSSNILTLKVIQGDG